MNQTTEKQTIMVVDDEPIILDISQSLLSMHNYEVVTAEDGKKAWDLYKQKPNIGVLVTDIEMPNMDGFELTKLIKQSNPALPVIMCSGNPYLETKAGESEADYFLEKPYKPSELTDAIAKALENNK